MSKPSLHIARSSRDSLPLVVPPESPPAVVSGAATAIDQDGATLNGVVNPSGLAVTDYHFEYGTTTALGTSTSSGTLSSGSTDQAVNRPIAGLNDETLYYYRLFATNAVGTASGNLRSFTTTATPPTTDLFDAMGWTNGDVAFLDPSTEPNVVTTWSYVTNGYEMTSTPANYDHAGDPSITTYPSGGDPSPGFDGLVHAGRRWLTTEGNQSIYDAPSGASTRNQVGGVSLYDRPYTFRAGERVALSMTTKLEVGGPMVAEGVPVSTAGNAGKFSMLNQYKSVIADANGQQGQPILGMDEGADGVRAWYAYNSNHYYPIPFARGIWVRLLFDVFWSTTTGGKFRVYADTSGGNPRVYEPVTDLVTGLPTIKATYNGAAMNFGPYHRMEEYGGVPRHSREYGVTEIIEHAVGDPW